MFELIINHLSHLFKYMFFYLCFYLIGRSTILLLNLIFKKRIFIDNSKLLYTSREIIYPVIGAAICGNLLVITNFFLPLKSFLVYLLIIGLISLNFLKIDFKKINLNILNIFSYLILPSILLFSIYNITWHYDAGYYHLNNQYWLRESNLIIGFVNIFWAFGMSSIYEYLSAILWLGNSFDLLSYLNIFFVHFFYLLITDNLVNSKEKLLKYSSLFILLFSILDNFGIDGGRNGFIYFQGVPKQDVSVAVLFLFLSRFVFISIQKRRITDIDLSLLSILTLFIIQIKLNSVTIFILFLFFGIFLIYNKLVNTRKFLTLSSPALFFGAIWVLKYYLTTGCLIFPVSVTCINSFDWYIFESTQSYEQITREASYTITKFDNNFNEWFSYFYSFQINRTVILNFLFSATFLIIFYIIFTEKKQNLKLINFYFIFYVIFNLVYLIFYGPTPRYSMGILLLIISYFGFIVDSVKFKVKSSYLFIVIFLSAVLLIRSTSYIAFINNDTTQLFDSRSIATYIESDNGWVKPDFGDQCWINLDCTMSNDFIDINHEEFFSVASRVISKK